MDTTGVILWQSEKEHCEYSNCSAEKKTEGETGNRNVRNTWKWITRISGALKTAETASKL